MRKRLVCYGVFVSLCRRTSYLCQFPKLPEIWIQCFLPLTTYHLLLVTIFQSISAFILTSFLPGSICFPSFHFSMKTTIVWNIDTYFIKLSLSHTITTSNLISSNAALNQTICITTKHFLFEFLSLLLHFRLVNSYMSLLTPSVSLRRVHTVLQTMYCKCLMQYTCSRQPLLFASL